MTTTNRKPAPQIKARVPIQLIQPIPCRRIQSSFSSASFSKFAVFVMLASGFV